MARRIEILRLDHRIFRDQRITSHVALTSRTFGATGFIYAGEKDENLEESISDVAKRWGGDFFVRYTDKISPVIKEFEGIVIHLTMYGERHDLTVATLNRFPDEDLLIILGGAKVPRYVYDLADFNTAIGWQPHSEVAAIALFLHELGDNSLLYSKREGASIEIKKNNSKARRSDRFQNI
ncbi:MAG: tRNA (cytidine(56)-2'-O)-methyltransferase [Candidatus Heimdallarchaeota archaeon]|nr:tRNA (cytidine(56)-2'-O)-methyltransferase [Candidatus Heimdallarchaeota archaeon]